MATKKQKRERVAEQRRQFEEERRLSGLQAQCIDIERREKRAELREKAAAKAAAEKQQAKVNAGIAAREAMREGTVNDSKTQLVPDESIEQEN